MCVSENKDREWRIERVSVKTLFVERGSPDAAQTRLPKSAWV